MYIFTLLALLQLLQKQKSKKNLIYKNLLNSPLEYLCNGDIATTYY